MSALDLLSAVGAAQDEYVCEACFTKANHTAVKKRFFFIAATIALLALLMGCAIKAYQLEHLVLIDHAAETTEHQELYVAEQVLSIQGYEDSPAYNALREWLAYELDYEQQHPESRFQSGFQRPDAYRLYACHSQEMVDKVDEICSKYGLHVMGKGTFLNSEAKMEEYGLSYVLTQSASTRCFYGELFEDGSFVASGELALSGEYDNVVQFQMHNIRKDAFYTVSLGMNDFYSYTQWNYKSKDGMQVLLALSSSTGLIIAENAERFICVIVDEVPDADMVFHGLPTDQAFLEAVCDSFNLSAPN